MARTGARLGQHFLKAPWAAHTLATTAVMTPGEMVVEIGPGKGALTKELLATGARVIAVEKDEALIEVLKEKFPVEIGNGALKIISDDIRNVSALSLGLEHVPYVIAANIPYYITGEIIRQFLTDKHPPKSMVLLIQKEVAQRIISKKESILSLSVKAYGKPRMVAKVSKGSFSPPPSVDSAILAVEGISRAFFADISEETFFKVVHAGFSSKRKLLSNNLSELFAKDTIQTIFNACGIAEKARAEDVSIEKWRSLATHA